MGNGLNRVYLLGNVGQDPRYKEFQDGGAILDVRLATNEGYKDRDGKWVDHTEWHNVVIKGKRATGIKKYVEKGTGLIIVGRLRTEKWEDKDGVQRYTTKVVADEIRFAGNRRGDDEGEEGDSRGRSRKDKDNGNGNGGDHDHDHDQGDSGGGQATGGADNYNDDDIPF